MRQVNEKRDGRARVGKLHQVIDDQDLNICIKQHVESAII